MRLVRILAVPSVLAVALALPLLLRQSATHAASPPPGAKAAPAPAAPPAGPARPALPPGSTEVAPGVYRLPSHFQMDFDRNGNPIGGAAPPAAAANAPAAPSAPVAPSGTCKTFGAGKCCSPDVTMHLAKEAVYAACGQSEATFVGEAASKDGFTCKYHFRVARKHIFRTQHRDGYVDDVVVGNHTSRTISGSTGQVVETKVSGPNSEDTTVHIFVGRGEEIPDKPTDPLFSYKKVGKAWIANRAKSPTAAAMSNATTGLYLAGEGYYVSVGVSTKVCTKEQAVALAKSMK